MVIKRVLAITMTTLMLAPSASRALSCDQLSSFAARVVVLKENEVEEERVHGMVAGMFNKDASTLDRVTELVYEGVSPTRINRLCQEYGFSLKSTPEGPQA